MLRLSGPAVVDIAAASVVAVPRTGAGMAWVWRPSPQALAVPVTVLGFVAAHGPSGEDLLEIIVPGNAWLVTALLDVLLWRRGQRRRRQRCVYAASLGRRPVTLDQAEAVLQVAQAADVQQAAQAVGRLRGAGQQATTLAPTVAAAAAMALVEAGLDFMEEDDVSAYDPQLQATLGEVYAVTQRWQRAARSVSSAPVAALVGPANAGKSSLYRGL